MADEDASVVRTHAPFAYAEAEDELQQIAETLRVSPRWSWAHPAVWRGWQGAVRRCQVDTLRSFFESVPSCEMIDTFTLDWARPISGIVRFTKQDETVDILYDDHQLFTPRDPDERHADRYMCRCKQCPCCHHVWISPYSMRVCNRCESLHLPSRPPRRQCTCECKQSMTLEELADDVRHGDIRIPQLCHYLFGKNQKHCGSKAKALARARARARAHGGGAKVNKAKRSRM